MEIRPNAERARMAIILIWIVLTVEMASLVSGYFQYTLLLEMQGGAYIPPEVSEMNDNRERLINLVFLVVYLISGILFIRWFRRAYYNLGQRVNGLKHSDGWAAGSWFVPFLNLARPYNMMRELYQETIDLLLSRTNVKELHLSTSFLGWWWFLWIIKMIVSNINSQALRLADTVDDFIFSTQVDMISDIVTIPLSMLAVKVISDYAQAEEQLVTSDGFEDESSFLLPELPVPGN